MELELFQIIFLILIGVLGGVAMSFLGYTSQGFVIPTILIITGGDMLLAIVSSIVNDLIAAIGVGINYIRKKEYKFRSDIFILLVIALIGSFLAVLIVMSTNITVVFGVIVPLFLICFGFSVLMRGFPTSETLKKTVDKLTERFSKKKTGKEEESEIIQESSEEFVGVIPPGSKLFYGIAIVLGLFMGMNTGMFGAASGFFIALVLIILYGYPLKKGVGTALVLGIIVCVFTFIVYQILGPIFKGQYYFDLTLTFYMGIGAFPAGLITSNFVQKMSAKAMGRAMGSTIMLLAVISLIFYLMS